MSARAFPGHPHYLAQAAAELGEHGTAAAISDAQRQPAVSQVSSLVSQALATEPGHGRMDSIRRARELALALKIAASAARIMLKELGVDLPDISPADAARAAEGARVAAEEGENPPDAPAAPAVMATAPAPEEEEGEEPEPEPEPEGEEPEPEPEEEEEEEPEAEPPHPHPRARSHRKKGH
jgi:hypothetical protein